MAQAEDIDNWFTHHPPTFQQVSHYEEIRHSAHQYAQVIQRLCPQSEERKIALNFLRSTVMWANASIACAPATTNDVVEATVICYCDREPAEGEDHSQCHPGMNS